MHKLVKLFSFSLFRCGVYFVIGTLFLLGCIPLLKTYAQESITLTTYYPAPYGDYGGLTAVNLTADHLIVGFAESSPQEFNLMQSGDTHIGRSLIVGAGEEDVFGFSYREGLITTDGDAFIKNNLAIRTTSPEFRLTLDKGAPDPDGGIMAIGFFGQGLPLTTVGPGTRLMWYPKKAAFRAGVVHADQWAEDNIGIYSVALGVDTKAFGESSVAMGAGTTASGSFSTAMGYESTATGVLGTAMGHQAKAEGNDSVAIGFQTTASGINSIAMGYKSKANGQYNIAIGDQTTTFGNFNTAIGTGTIAGDADHPNYQACTAMGGGTKASGDGSTAMGWHTKASGPFSVAMGRDTTASAYGSVAMGLETTASGIYSVAAGRGTTASLDDSLAIGQYNSPAHALFSIGNGLSDASRSNAFVVLKEDTQSRVGIGTTPGWGSWDSLRVEGGGIFVPHGRLEVGGGGDVSTVIICSSDITSGRNIHASGNIHADGNVTVNGSLSASSVIATTIGASTAGFSIVNASSVMCGGAKCFLIDHPTRKGMELVHSTVEGPEIAVFYRGEAQLFDGQVEVELPSYFEALTREVGRTVQLTAKGSKPFLLSASEVINGRFTAYGAEPDGAFYWEVKAVRADLDPLEVERPQNEEENL